VSPAAENSRRRALLNQDSITQDENPAAQLRQHAGIVRDHQEAEAFPHSRSEQIQDASLGRRIQPIDRFIEDEQSGPCRQYARQRGAALFPAAQLARIGVGDALRLIETHPAEQPARVSIQS
jgi:hypothetical protein